MHSSVFGPEATAPAVAAATSSAAASSASTPGPDAPMELSSSAIGETELPAAKKRANRADAASVDVASVEQLMANLGLKPVLFVRSGAAPAVEAPSEEPTMHPRGDEAVVFDRTIDHEHDGDGPG